MILFGIFFFNFNIIYWVICMLSYEYDFLQPYVEARVIEIHYNKHYKKYVENLRKMVGDIPADYVIQNIDNFVLNDRGKILYNAGGVLNHEIYFKSLGDKVLPNGLLLDKIEKQFGSFLNFKNEFISKAKSLVGSGYTFLAVDDYGELYIMNLSNQENPLSYGLIGIFAIDLWEHAYYLQYLNDRDAYIDNIWNVVNFDYASKIYNSLAIKK